MYEAVPSGGAPTIITPTHRNKLLMYDADDDGENDLPEDYYVECETVPHQQPDDGRQRVPGASASPSHTTYATNSGRPRIASTLVHIAERDRAHRTARHSVNNNNALANERRPLTIADADNNYISERIIESMVNERAAHAKDNVMPPVMEDSRDCRDDLNERKDSNGPEAHINGRTHPEEWKQRNGITQRNGECRRSEREENCCVGMGERIDVDQIKLEHYRLKTQNVGVQTTHLSPYRLRFWPVAASIKCLDASFMDVVKCCLRTLSQWFLSQVGLTCVLIVWALLGATAFYKTEGPREREQAEQIDHYKVDISIDLATDLRQLKEGSDKWPETIQKYLNKHESLLLQAVSSGYVEGGGSIWTYPGCVLFAVLLLTTLGFGAPVPRTSLGRGMAVLFSAVGIPLHFMLIINASSLIAKCLRNLATIKPAGEMPEAKSNRRLWYKWFPPIVAVLYYILGVIGFGVLRQRSVVECLMFALDFTESGGVANTAGHVRILYALYIEIAVILAATIMSIVQVSATNGIIDLGLRLGLLTNT
ncbi:uncharacterized protein [Atheta coriaria]